MTSGSGRVSIPDMPPKRRRPVMVCTRLDEGDGTTVSTGWEWATLLETELLVCHVLNVGFGSHAGADTKHAIRHYLDRHAPGASREATILIAEGDPEDAIPQVAAKFTPQLVVVGPSIHWTLWPRSHAAEHLTTTVDASVLVARRRTGARLSNAPDTAPPSVRPGVGPVLVGVDMSPQALVALHAGDGLRQLLEVPLIAAHLIEPPRLFSGGDVDDDEQAVTEALRAFVSHVPDVQLAVRHARAARGLLRESKRSRAVVLVIGPSGSGDAAGLGSTARAVVRGAHCSVLVARADFLDDLPTGIAR